MRIDESLYATFLKEMEALDVFHASYRKRYPGAPLDPEDPDVRRLMEAMALLSARTRLAAETHINSTHRRMFQQFFPYLLTPLPSMAIIQALPSRRLADGVACPKGSVMRLSPETGGSAHFKTLQALNILPLAIDGVRLTPRADGGSRLIIALKTPFPRNDEIGRLSLFVNHLNDYESSLAIHMGLSRHLERVSVFFDEAALEEGCGTLCGASFGLDRSGPDTGHPLERERLFFHFPWQELFVHVDVPAPERAWSRLSVCFDLSSSWPGGESIAPDVFHLFAVPVINLLQDRARPVICNGTRESCSLSHPDAEKQYALHSVQGVFEVTGQGLVPLDSALLSESAPSWEVDETLGERGAPKPRLNLNFPQAFDDPRTLSITGCWYQPWFSDAVSRRLEVEPYARMAEGVAWGLAVSPVAHRAVAFGESLDVFLKYLTLTNRVELSRHEILDILAALGLTGEGRFAPVLGILGDVAVERRGAREKGTGSVVYTYTMGFGDHGKEMEPLVQLFLDHVDNILKAWVASASIEVRRAVG